MKEKTVFLMGGLGNQISQLNLGENLKNKNIKVRYSSLLIQENLITKLLGWKIHDFVLSKLFNVENVKTKFFIDIWHLCMGYLSRLFSCNVAGVILEKKNINSFDQIKYLNSFIGYWQSPLLINDIGVQKIKEILRFKIHKKPNSQIIHIRGGDFMKKDRISYKYLKKAISYIDQGSELSVITNDVDFSENLLHKAGIKTYKFITGSVSQDFIALTESNFIICSNSTFSIWGSLLSEAEIILIPKTRSNRMLKDFKLNQVKKEIKYV